MGISTFAHLLTESEMKALQCVTVDSVIKDVLNELCDRPFLGSEYVFPFFFFFYAKLKSF
jgi:hypothetical protein